MHYIDDIMSTVWTLETNYKLAFCLNYLSFMGFHITICFFFTSNNLTSSYLKQASF